MLDTEIKKGPEATFSAAFDIKKKIVSSFYTALIASVLIFITVSWFDHLYVSGKARLSRVFSQGS